MIGIFTAIHVVLIFIFRHVFVIDEPFVIFHSILFLVPAVLRASDGSFWIINFDCRFLCLETLLMLIISSFNFIQTLFANHFLILFKFAAETTWSYVLEL